VYIIVYLINRRNAHRLPRERAGLDVTILGELGAWSLLRTSL
jgi:hypothetical protein